MQIINSNTKENKEIKMIPEMLNLLGCSKDNFKKLLKIWDIKYLIKRKKLFLI
jgi:ATP-dependent RNA helicase SUPV3L1/SUV3